MMKCGNRWKLTAAIGMTAMAFGWGCGAPQQREAASSEHGTPASEPAAEATPPAEGAPSEGAIFAIYEGTLPCADCGGIKTELTLMADGSSYKLVETYLGTKEGDKSMESVGKWSTMKGTTADPNATIYMLDTGDPVTMRHYLVTSESEIKMLDKDLKEIASDQNYSLMKRAAAPATS